LSDLQQELDPYNAQITEKYNELNGPVREFELTHDKDKMSELQKSINKVETEIFKITREREKISEKIKPIKYRIAKLKSDIIIAESKKPYLEGNQFSRGIIERLQTKKDNITPKIKKLNDSINTLEKRISSMDSEETILKDIQQKAGSLKENFKDPSLWEKICIKFDEVIQYFNTSFKSRMQGIREIEPPHPKKL